ncbi:MAG: BolA family transcriptional regulator [Gammaproteobacteria bacterium]|nr:BolA family transcriptional regulator [Gammaproteobacteria bacterium]
MNPRDERITVIRERLEAAFAPVSLEIIDESHKHAGHASAKGGGHFIIQIVSNAFAGKSPVQRHRMVFEAMGDLMHSEVHALSIQADTPK